MKKILFASEASYLSSGYSRFYKELIERFYKEGQYDIAEFASYGSDGSDADYRYQEIPWKYYPNNPNVNDAKQVQAYKSSPINEFGAWRWENTSLDYQPDIVIDLRDHWYCKHELHSPFRPFYNLVWVPTVDSYPQKEEWVADYAKIDKCFTYTDWGKRVLEEQSLQIDGIVSPGVNSQIFKPVRNKEEAKKYFGLSEDTLLIGTTMRNQVRKLYPELISSFIEFLKTAPKEIAGRTFLLLHTSWPDLGWDIPSLLKEFGVTNKTFLTYTCHNEKCKHFFISLFQDTKTFCPKCKSNSAHLISSHKGVTVEQLALIYNIMDVYVQYATAEGFGIPQIEAAACGVPIISVNYSGMCDVIEKLQCHKVDVSHYFRESLTGRYFGYPKNEQLISNLIEILSLPGMMRRSLGFSQRVATEKHFNWDKSYEVLKKGIEDLEKKDWKVKPTLVKPNLNVPARLTDEQFINWGFVNILRRPDLINSYMNLRMIRDLWWGKATTSSPHYFTEESQHSLRGTWEKFDRDTAVKYMLKIVDFNNQWETIRKKKLGL